MKMMASSSAVEQVVQVPTSACKRTASHSRACTSTEQSVPAKLRLALMEAGNRFLARNVEKEDLNQYWYSPATIKVLVQELLTVSQRAAFLSTPSLYFSLPKSSELRKGSVLFDLDKQWHKEPNFVLYDFNNPEDIPVNVHNTFDCVVIDPPFITKEVWTSYAAATKLLLAPGGRIVLSTIPENDSFLKQLLGVTPQKFQPSIPHLVYQYCIYTNYNSTLLSQINPEIIADA